MSVSIETIISRLGGIQQTADTVNVGTEAVRKWRQSGCIPPKHWPKISQASGFPIEEFQTRVKPDNVQAQKPQGATALLLLEDGSLYWGVGAGSFTDKPSIGELCFSTSMTGYQETISDPSYAEQIITFTTPHIGNVGVNIHDNESYRPLARGAIIHEISDHPSNYRSQESLHHWLQKHHIPALTNVDTRTLTRKIRDEGPQNALLYFPKNGRFPIEKLKEELSHWPGLAGKEIAAQATCEKKTKWEEPTLSGFSGPHPKPSRQKRHVVAIDYGIKHNILRCLVSSGCEVTIVPAATSSEEILALKPQGILLSNGPGDPAETAKYAVPIIKELIKTNIPIMGICLGHQLLVHAFGAQTHKMKHGHRGVNQPVKNLQTGSVDITSQNHGFSANNDSSLGTATENFISLFDQSNEGLKHKSLPIFSVQYHPEASPGPSDCYYLFEYFVDLIDTHISH